MRPGHSAAGVSVIAPGPDRFRSTAGRNIALAGAFLVALSCQAVFGDYRIDTSNVREPEPCEPGESRCSGATLETCAPDGFSFEPEVTCESAALCNVDTEGCTPCTPEEHQCNGAVLRKCTSGGTWMDLDTCKSPRLCMVSGDKSGGSCMDSCEPGAFRCTNLNLERCSREGERWELLESCASQELCSVELAAQQTAAGEPVHCASQLCRPGEFACDDGSVRACNMALSGWDPPTTTCDPKDSCNPKAGACQACMPGEHACSGATPYTCNASGKWDRRDDCASPALCQATSGTCMAPQCTPGAYQCDPMDVLLQRCRTDRTSWDTLASCSSLALCKPDEGRCEPAACQRDTVRCQGSRRERCSGNLTGWDLVETCKQGELCDPLMGCVPGKCAANTTRCNDRFFERCVEGQWQRVDRCVTRELCAKAVDACPPPVCNAGEYNCNGAVLERCPLGRDGYAYIDTCMSADRCDELIGMCK